MAHPELGGCGLTRWPNEIGSTRWPSEKKIKKKKSGRPDGPAKSGPAERGKRPGVVADPGLSRAPLWRKKGRLRG